jgi:thiol-disulfide isomerase/thioredoxin
MLCASYWGSLAAVLLAIQCGPVDPPARPAAPAYPSLLGQAAPPVEGELTWLNAPAVSWESLRGKVVVLQFFDYSCVNCIRTYPYLREWHRRYAPLGVEIIGIHSPQYQFSTDPNNVLRSVRRYELPYPIAVDSHLKIAEAYGNRYWPRLLILDPAGVVRFDHTGEGAYAAAERMIQDLVRRTRPGLKLPAVMPPVHDFDKPGVVCYPVTAEVYLGKLRGKLGNPELIATNAPIRFTLPAERVEGQVYAHGVWSVADEYMRHAADQEHLDDCLLVKYRATELNVVMKPESIYWMEVFVELDGAPIPKAWAGSDVQYTAEGRSFVRVDEPRMYQLISRQPYRAAEARLCVRGQGLSVYSFSFGTCVIPTDAERLRPGGEKR